MFPYQLHWYQFSCFIHTNIHPIWTAENLKFYHFIIQIIRIIIVAWKFECLWLFRIILWQFTDKQSLWTQTQSHVKSWDGSTLTVVSYNLVLRVENANWALNINIKVLITPCFINKTHFFNTSKTYAFTGSVIFPSSPFLP